MTEAARSMTMTWDPYEVWRTLILDHPELLLKTPNESGLKDRQRAMQFATTIAEYPSDLQDFLFILAQEQGIDAAHAALDQAVRRYFKNRAQTQKQTATPVKRPPPIIT